MKTLDEIAIEHGADKASVHPVRGHDYARHYDKLFAPIRLDNLRVLEIGCGGGESMRTWLEYFPNAYVFGVDIVSHTNPWNTPGSNVHPRYQFLHGNQADATMWACLVATWGAPFDIAIDDGGHFSDQMVPCMGYVWPNIRPGGYLCLEDLACCYSSIFIRSPQTAMDVVKQRLDQLHQGTDIDSAYFARELAIVRKKA